jgi:hypothetical protein
MNVSVLVKNRYDDEKCPRAFFLPPEAGEKQR